MSLTCRDLALAWNLPSKPPVRGDRPTTKPTSEKLASRDQSGTPDASQWRGSQAPLQLNPNPEALMLPLRTGSIARHPCRVPQQTAFPSWLERWRASSCTRSVLGYSAFGSDEEDDAMVVALLAFLCHAGFCLSLAEQTRFAPIISMRSALVEHLLPFFPMHSTACARCSKKNSSVARASLLLALLTVALGHTFGESPLPLVWQGMPILPKICQ